LLATQATKAEQSGPNGPPSAALMKIGLLTVGSIELFVIARCPYDARMALERIPEHQLVGDALRSRVEGRRQLLQGPFSAS